VATTLSIVNKVLRKLRESTVSSIDGDEGAELILDFLNETLKEVEDAWNWQALKVGSTITLEDGVVSYALTDIKQGSVVYYLYNQTKAYYLTPDADSVERGNIVTSPTEGSPRYWKYNGYDSNGDMVITVHPKPNETDTIIASVKSVHGTLDATTDLNTVISLPENVVYLGTYAKAVAERGEDDGETFNKADLTYRLALSNAVQIEDSNQGQKHSTWSN
jgi:hypothetical protein